MIDEKKIGLAKHAHRRPVPRKIPHTALPIEPLLAALLAYLAERPDDMLRFFQITGLAPQSLRYAAALPGFAESLLDHLCSDDRLLQSFAAKAGYDPASIDAVRQSLSSPFGEEA